MSFRTYIFCFSFFLLFSACEKEIAVVPENLDDLLVVEATIENGQPPLVFLTRSMDYFNQLDSASFAKSFVRNAVVTVSDGSYTVQLKEYAQFFGAGQAFYYTIDSTRPSQILIGKMNTQYQLSIEANGKSYHASTTISSVARKSDSLWWQPAPNNPDTNNVVVFLRVTDPKGYGNYVRYYTSVNDSAFVPGYNSVYDDQVIDGTTYTAQVFRGQNRNIPVDRNTFGYFRRGEKVIVKLCNIDKATYDFWRTWEQNQSNLGNPFAVPVKVIGNISNGALGYFGGYASQVSSIIIPH